MKTVSLRIQEEIPVIAEADVLVVGGGPGGLGAAVMAARCGMQVILAEREGLLGGMASIGEVTPFMSNHVQDEANAPLLALDRPVYPAWVEKMRQYLPKTMQEAHPEDPEVASYFSRMIAKDIAPLAAEDLCLEAGVHLLYHHQLVRTIMDGKRIDCAVFASKSGFVAVRAKQFVDTTGDADLTILAGGEAEFGGESGYCQPMTLCFKLDHVDWNRLPSAEERKRLWDEAKAAGKIHCPRENMLIFSTVDTDVMHFNTTRVVKKSAVNGVELSEAEIEGHSQLREIVRWLTAEVPGFENAQLRSVAAHIGVRESRRIKGLAYLTREAFEKRAKFDDAVLRCNYNIDIHSPTGAGTELVWMPMSEYYEVPYGCIVPRGVENLTVGGRPVSVDQAIHSSLRVMPPACSLGQAAGTAAAIAIQNGKTPGELDGRAVRARLKELGANL